MYKTLHLLMKNAFKLLAIFGGIGLLVTACFWLSYYSNRDLALPRTIVGNLEIGGMTRWEAQAAVRVKIEEFSAAKFQIAARGEVQEVSIKDFGITVDESALMAEIPFAGNMSNAAIALTAFAGKRILVNPSSPISRSEILRVIDEKFPTIPKARNAHFERKGAGHGADWKIVDGETGVSPDAAPIVEKLTASVKFLEVNPLFVSFEESSPTIFAGDLARDFAKIKSVFPGKITLTYDKQKWIADFEKNPDWIVFGRRAGYLGIVDGGLDYSLEWDPVAFAQFLRDAGVSEGLEQAPEDARIWNDESGAVQFLGHAVDGRAIEKEFLLEFVNSAISDGKKENEVEIPAMVVKPKVEVSEDLQKLGILGLIAVGHTSFIGSPPNRIHNIGVGVAKFNGVIIPEGATFSFDDNLGVVDETTGYKKELVIKAEGTIPEFGGGLCQVSSTMYRAAIYGGLPIVDRSPHKYIVTYYSQIGGPGLDATIYPPLKDMKFLNDTPGSILIQSYVDGLHAYFKFYGTDDGRSVAMDGPVISARVPAPTEPMLVTDKKMAPGEKKQVEKAHAGFSTLWTRTITSKNGEVKKEEIKSKYYAVPDKFLVGGDVAASAKNKSATDSANPFE